MFSLKEEKKIGKSKCSSSLCIQSMASGCTFIKMLKGGGMKVLIMSVSGETLHPWIKRIIKKEREIYNLNDSQMINIWLIEEYPCGSPKAGAKARTLRQVVYLRSDSEKHMVGSGETGDMIDRKTKKAYINWNYNS